MNDQNKKNKPAYFRKFKIQDSKIKITILIFIIITLILIGYKALKNKTTSYQFEDNNIEVEVVDSSGKTIQTDAVEGTQNNSLEPTVNPLQDGPATIEDLGGNSSSTNIEDLLKDKQIEVNQ